MTKLAIITGGTGGLGRELSLAFGAADYRVIALYRSDPEAAAKLEKDFSSRGNRGETAQIDIAQPESIQRIRDLAEAHRDVREIVLVNNACERFAPTPFHQLGWDAFQGQIDSGLKGAFHCTQALLKSMLSEGRRGTIVNILSIAMDEPVPKGFSAYLSAKSAMRGLAQSLVSEYGPRGLRVLNVLPGIMRTPLTAGWDPRIQEMVGLDSGRTPDCEKVAESILAKVQDAGSDPNGVCLRP